MRLIDIAFVAVALTATPAIADPQSDYVFAVAAACGRNRPIPEQTKCTNDVLAAADRFYHSQPATASTYDRQQQEQIDATNRQTRAIQDLQNQRTICNSDGYGNTFCYNQ